MSNMGNLYISTPQLGHIIIICMPHCSQPIESVYLTVVSLYRIYGKRYEYAIMFYNLQAT